ncbi:MAG: hypothetical protein Q7S05_02720 [bacterium]|nr:hypothetical protein [bacterium]
MKRTHAWFFLIALIFGLGILVGMKVASPTALTNAPELADSEISDTAATSSISTAKTALAQQSNETGNVSPSTIIPNPPAISGATAFAPGVIQSMQPAVTWSGTPITIEFDENGATPNVISVRRNEAATLILQAKGTIPQEGISFLASQSSGGAPGPIKPGTSETVIVRPARSFFYSPRSPDNKTRYPFYIYINVYY